MKTGNREGYGKMGPSSLLSDSLRVTSSTYEVQTASMLKGNRKQRAATLPTCSENALTELTVTQAGGSPTDLMPTDNEEMRQNTSTHMKYKHVYPNIKSAGSLRNTGSYPPNHTASNVSKS
jgi:hypothetical protein